MKLRNWKSNQRTFNRNRFYWKENRREEM